MKIKSRLMFTIVLVLDFLYTLYNYFDGFKIRDNNLLVAVYFFLDFIPLAFLIFLSGKIYKINDKKKLSHIKIFLICYLALDVIMGVVTYNLYIPNFITCLFYSNGWFYDIVYLFEYQMYFIGINLSIIILYWISYAFLLIEVSNLIYPNNVRASTREQLPDENKTSPSFKISIADSIVLGIQTIFSILIFCEIQNQKNTTGEHALGAAFVVIALLFIKLIISVPTVVLSIFGIVNGKLTKNKTLKQNQKGFIISIVCLVVSELQVWLLW